jgi:two-component system phosphate regulon sensor histidine kinase PhoR
VRLSRVTGAQITVIGADGLIQGDSHEPETVGRPIGDAFEVSRARKGATGRLIRRLHPDGPLQYLVAVPADQGRVIRLAVPLDDVLEARANMRNRLIVGFGFGLLGSLLLSFIFIRAITRPLQLMTLSAERLAQGHYDTPTVTNAGGELGVLATAMTHMTSEIRARIDELTEQRDLLSVVFGGLVEGVVVVDPRGKIVLVNDAAKPLVGDGMPEKLAPLVARANTGEPADGELELSGRIVRASARPLQGNAGAIAVLSDITRMRALEEVRREFLSNAAHELRTPVTSISGYAETLLGGGVDAATSTEFLQTIHRNAQRIAMLVTDLLVLDTLEGRAEAVGERRAIALAQVAHDAARTTKGVTPRAEIDVAVAGDLAVLGTRDGLDHVVQNLVDNAAKYGGGTKVTVRATALGERVRLEVSDRGAGVPKDHAERVFERFYRLDYGRSRNQGGSGLGLAIVKSQVEAMGGRVWVEDNGPGAKFVVELDRATLPRTREPTLI